MDDQSNQSLYNIVNAIIGAYLKLISDVIKIVNLEAILAKKSFVRIIILTMLAGTILFSTWLSLLGLLLLYLIKLNYSWLLAMSAITLLNVIILFIIFIVIMQLKKNLSFSATRRQISNLKTTKREPIDDRIETSD
jgi:uncharacterized membrane protein YqjE